jgi:uncharacterized protein (TIGR00251 family)
MEDAIEPVPGGVRLLLDVHPGASDDRFPAGYERWRRRIKARVQAQAQDGQANAAVVRLVAQALGVPAARGAITAGALDRRKSVVVAGLAREDAVRLLQGKT